MSVWVDEPRAPAVAGRFYPAGSEALDRDVRRYLRSDREPTRVLALVGPHAGFMYSGAILGATYAATVVPRTVIIMCPNHTGRGVRRSVWCGGAWSLPGGDVPVDAALAKRLVDEAGLTPDREAHRFEHAIEVHLPFLRARRPDVRVVPITLARLDRAAAAEVGAGLARAIAASPEPVLLVASTDMSHFLDAATTKRLDDLALSHVLALDPDGLHATVEAEDISMCGYVPTTIALHAAKALGASEAELVGYANSGDVSGDYDRVVGYAGLTIR